MIQKTKKFADSERTISRLGFGAWGLSGIFEKCSGEELIKSVINCLDQGIDFIDTARDYGDSEQILGKALKVYGGKKPFISTKIQSKGPGMLRWGMPRDVNEVFPKGWITKSAEESLKQLGLEKVELIQLHLYWSNWGLEGYWMEELQQLKEQGKTDFIGISIPNHRHENALTIVNSGLIDSIQTIVNIFDPYAFDSLVPLCQEKKVAVLVRCVLDQGGLTGFLTSDTYFEEGDLRGVLFSREIREEYIERVNLLKQYIPTYASSLTSLAIKFVLAHPGITSALISMHIEKFANENIAVLKEPPLPEPVFQEIRMHHRWLKNLFNKVYWSDGIYRNSKKVRWEELLPEEFVERQQQCPLVYLPIGLCEPHGHIAAFGLDTIKAVHICEEAAKITGGIVAPTQGYHIHETGYHAPWLEEVLGEVNPFMTSIPPDMLLHLFLYQLRAFSNAGFKGLVVITGHAGGNQEDLRTVATAFMKNYSLKVEIRADPELVEGKYEGDHAGIYEISQLMYLRPDLVDMSKIEKQHEDKSLGRFALGLDAAEASPELGKKIMDACVYETCEIAKNLMKLIDGKTAHRAISFKEMDDIWQEILAQRVHWYTYNLQPGQVPASQGSRWKISEKPF